MTGTVAYNANPVYPPLDGQVVTGWPEAVATLPPGAVVLAVDGPAILDWDALIDGIEQALSHNGRLTSRLDLRDHLAPWEKILELTASPALPDDPHFATLATCGLAELFEELPSVAPPADGINLVFGPGAALVRPDVLWYADLPKRYAEAAVGDGTGKNLGQRAGAGTTKRLLYTDWPILDRHRDDLSGGIDRWIDAQHPASPCSLDGATFWRTLADLATRPFRTRPTFNTSPWGGHWAQTELGMNREAPNTALGYELIAPESGILIGQGPGHRIEVPFQLVVTRHPLDMLGEQVHADFGTSFPIRFDYLDTVGGGNLSVHCHPQSDYMRRVFGWPYTQHETYYVLVGGEDRRIFLGLGDGVDLESFQAKAHAADDHGVPFDIEQYIQTFPATPHQLFMIPAGTPHGSGEGNVVLEISATPYLYSLRFYDWLRRDDRQRQRPVHVDHAFANLDSRRRGPAVAEQLIQRPRRLRGDEGWHEELIGASPDMFFEVRRYDVAAGQAADDDTNGRFHVLNVVEGDGIALETASGIRHDLAYAETIVVPASVGPYRIRPLGPQRARIVKSLVRS